MTHWILLIALLVAPIIGFVIGWLVGGNFREKQIQVKNLENVKTIYEELPKKFKNVDDKIDVAKSLLSGDILRIIDPIGAELSTGSGATNSDEVKEGS